MILLTAISLAVGYAASHVGIPPVAMFGIVSFASFVGEYARRLTLHYYHRQEQEQDA